ncbi:unnamed protein product [Spirodela intermedia]|uniref:Protein kinase domain-containing protein n=1 Tax=Spirodela intermedia TaxID=51605 RepID=A0A7I8KW89_SPIIN|nr:unnamed protein product [Spirodela intermedia]
MAASGWLRGPAIGQGSTATVYLATTTTSSSSAAGRTQQTFALKSTELSRSTSLQREHAMLSSLSNPHLVASLGATITSEPGGRIFFNLAMEYVPGGDLSEEIKRSGPLDEPAVRGYTRGILSGLAYLHSAGIAHCDVKGENILLLGSGGDATVKIADLGCARWVDGGDEAISGTPLYMPPEVARGEQQGAAADIWALGCTVVEMMTGKRAWPNVTDPVAAMHRIAFSGDVPEFPPNVSGEAVDFLGRCLRREPEERWSAEELLRHPFVNCEGQFAAGGSSGPETKASPRSALDWGFWVAEEEEPEVEEGLPANPHAEDFSSDSMAERLRRLTSCGVPLSPAPDFLPWEESSWMTVRSAVEVVVGAASSLLFRHR